MGCDYTGVTGELQVAAQRIQKVLAAAGIASRRASEELVEAGRVQVNGVVVRSIPCLVDVEQDKILVDGKPIRRPKHVYYMLNKPKGVFCTNNDPSGRARAIDLMTGVRERVFAVGRLDAESMGLLLMTNDGELAQKLAHPRFQTPKTYRAEVSGSPSPETLHQLREGVWLSEGRTAPATITVVHRQRDSAILEITLRESRNREVRRMLAKLGHAVRRLTRIRMGKLSTQKLPIGAYRELTPAEVKYLYRLTESPHEDDRPPQRRRSVSDRPSRGQTQRPSSSTRRGRPNASSRPKKGSARGPASPHSGGRRIIRPS